MKQKIVVVGNGMVGHHFVEQLMGDERFEITVLGAEPRPAYDRVHLSAVFSGSAPEDLALADRDVYKVAGVTAHFGEAVTAIHREQKKITTQLGRKFSYDKLVLATGSYPFVPPVPGHDHKNCFVYRTIDDLGHIRAAAKNSKVGVVVGGGLLGLEAANALCNLGLETHVVQFSPQLMEAQVDMDGGAILRRKIEALGIRVHTNKNTQKIVALNKEGPLEMQFADGGVLPTDMIVFSAGVRPDDKLAKAAELKLGERGGIVIDYHCKTSDSDIYAIGECALWAGKIFGLVAPGYQMAKVAADALRGGSLTFNGADMSTKLKLLGVDVGSIGDAHAKTPGSKSYRIVDEHQGLYKKIVVNAEADRLLGAVLVGDNSDYDTFLQYLLNEIPLSGNPMGLIVPGSEGKPTLGAAALPMTATICSCHNVSKQSICDSIASGCCTVGDVKVSTKASTGCGGCSALLKNVVETELAARGVSVDRSLCEHFAHTRQELYHLVRVGKISSFDELLAKHGKASDLNLGCDICKPTAASIFASVGNDYILKDKHRGLQDSNDHFLANIQKDGTYSVVPRIPGGEITPDKLIVIGQVAKKYDLYTKITGGQRIDLFGARAEQLPVIWKELIDAGMETGHAYGKALRTVKSCVGSSWCRYGVQDSVGMAIQVENRYKGLRSPHKLKMAVSGCTRECAEAQSKDVGVIATEKGWNLYVCGNGGMKPRHADLFAADLDDAMLIKYIDRFFMFYIRTADRLQRTSVWLDNLEGGLEYLRSVIIDDKLGINAELEAEMALVVDTYQCEWLTTISDPEKVKRFSHFVNSKAPDNNIVFVKERGQIRPAREDERMESEKIAVAR